MCVYECMYVCTYVCTYVCMYVCLYLCIYICDKLYQPYKQTAIERKVSILFKILMNCLIKKIYQIFLCQIIMPYGMYVCMYE